MLAKAGDRTSSSFDSKTKKSKSIYTDKTGTYTSTHFDAKGNLWVTDFTGKIDNLNPDGSGFTTTYSGKLAAGADDLSFDQQGSMFVTDTHRLSLEAERPDRPAEPAGQGPEDADGRPCRAEQHQLHA